MIFRASGEHVVTNMACTLFRSMARGSKTARKYTKDAVTENELVCKEVVRQVGLA